MTIGTTGFEACHHVLDLPEVAEAIFLQLDVCDVIVAVTRTCKQWKAIVEGSTKLQQLLFSKPISSNLLQYFDDHTQYPQDITGRWSTSADDFGIHKIFSHPLLTFMSDWHSWDDLNWEAIRRPEASWKKALATQPPVSKIAFEWCEHVAENDAGVTLDELVPAGFPSQPARIGCEVHTFFRREDILGEQEFEHELASFSDLQDLQLKPLKAKKTPIEWA